MVLHAINEKPQNRSLGAKNGSFVFNGWKKPKKRHGSDDEEEGEVHECRSGTALQLVVFDASRDQVVACKVEPTVVGSFGGWKLF